MENSTSSSPETTKASATEVFWEFLRLGLTSFGGPTAHIGYFRLALVEKKRWLSDHQFAQLLALCQFLQGPTSSQLGLLLGLLRAGWLGALAAFLAFTLPSAIVLFLLAVVLPQLDPSWSTPLIHGLKLVAVAVVANAVWGMFKQFCNSWWHQLIGVASIAAVLLLAANWTQLLVIAAAAAIGLMLPNFTKQQTPDPVPVPYGKGLGLLLLGLFFALLASTLIFTFTPHLQILSGIYQAGALVFGGGHVVLPLLESTLVTPGWLAATDFMAGYGAAQTVPGPLFTVAAYLGALLPEGFGGAQGALLCLLALFLPGFLLVLGAIPFWAQIMENPLASRAISGVNAAVVGLLAAALYDPVITSSITGWLDIGIVVISLIMLVRKFSVLWVILWSLTSVSLLSLI